MNVGILGLGLIGGSLARAYAKAGHRVYASDKDTMILSFAQLADASVVKIEVHVYHLQETIKGFSFSGAT